MIPELFFERNKVYSNHLISAGGFVMRSRNACQYWRSTEKSI